MTEKPLAENLKEVHPDSRKLVTNQLSGSPQVDHTDYKVFVKLSGADAVAPVFFPCLEDQGREPARRGSGPKRVTKEEPRRVKPFLWCSLLGC